MSRPIAYNATATPISGSIIGAQGYIAYTTDGAGNDYPNGHGGIVSSWVPSADGAAPIVFVTDTYTQGYTGDPAESVPLFFACAGTSSAAIIYTANRVPHSPGDFTDANEAITELTKNQGYFILESNDPFEGINADSLALDVDASKMSSYPQIADNWYDLSGNQNTSTLINGPTFDSNGWLVFDGTNDYSLGSGTLGQDCTVELWISSSNYNGTIPLSIDGASYGSGPNIYFTNNIRAWNTGDGSGNAFSNSSYPNAQWHHIVVTNDYNVTAKLYIDGKLIGTANPLNATTTGASSFWIGRFHGGGYYISSFIKSARIYNTALTEAEIKQNYFGSNIVTDGMIFMVDANNIVSYQKSGTTAYNLTGSNTLTLYNGLGYKQGYGGYFDVDGTDDAMTTPDAANLDIANNFTVEGWVWWNRHKDYASLLVKGPGGSGQLFNYSFFFYASNIRFGFGDGGGYIAASINTSVVPTNTWHHIMGTYDGSNLKFYLNGELKNTVASSATPNQNNDALNVIQASYPIDGRIASARVYNRALSAEEVLQNYQAEQYRFAGPQGIPTYGLVMNLDASNIDSYPGTGTTWYDLTGNGNDVSLINGPTYISGVNGGYFQNDVDSYFSGAGTATIPTGNSAYTMLVWARQPASWGNNDGFISIGGYFSTSQSNALRTLNATTGHFHHYWWGNDLSLTNNNAGIQSGDWFMVAATFDGTTRRIWVNGVSRASDTPTGHNVTSTTIQVSKTVGGEYQEVDMAVARIYNRALTSDEMLQTYDIEKTRFGL